MAGNVDRTWPLWQLTPCLVTRHAPWRDGSLGNCALASAPVSSITALDASARANLRMFRWFIILIFLFLFWPSLIPRCEKFISGRSFPFLSRLRRKSFRNFCCRPHRELKAARSRLRKTIGNRSGCQSWRNLLLFRLKTEIPRFHSVWQRSKRLTHARA